MLEVKDLYRHMRDGRYSAFSLKEVIDVVRATSPTIDFWQHPLGFCHGELTPHAGAAVGERLRLHIWLDDSGSGDQLGDLHEHTWHLTSLVLRGVVHDENFEIISAQDGRYAGSRILYGEVNQTRAEGRFDLQQIKDRIVIAGSAYTIPSRTIHINHVEALPTVTLVRSVEDQRGDGPLVLSSKRKTQGLVTGTRRKLSRPEVATLLEGALR